MTNEQLDILIRRADITAVPDPTFVAVSHRNLSARVRGERTRRRTRFGHLQAELRLAFATTPSTPIRLTPMAMALLVVATLLALLAVVGALQRTHPQINGPLVVAARDQLDVIDPATGGVRTMVPPGEHLQGITRSPDGRAVTFWAEAGAHSRLYVMGIDGRDRRELIEALSVRWDSAIDTFSSDSRFLATEVTIDGEPRILVVDTVTGEARLITPAGMSAHNPLWSPDDRWLAFSTTSDTTGRLMLIRPDGTGMRSLVDDAGGPDTWSPDGRWIYFVGEDAAAVQHVYRADVAGGPRQQLTDGALHAGAAASSPDGTRLAFMADALYGWDLWVANADGSAPHMILAAAGLGGWSPDGQLLLARWKPPDPARGGLVTVRTDGSDLRVLVPYDATCRTGWAQVCELGFGWGVARP
jgi:dipeptidyl aminopeptidase/acylaminoacyl peptidase